MPQADAEARQVYQKRYYEQHREAKQVRARLNYYANFDARKEAQARRMEALDDESRARMNARNNASKYKLKREVLAHYSGGTMSCARCGFADARALSIDHVASCGTAHRREVGGGGTATYRWLRRNGYPDGFGVLCMNCQFIKRHENSECPGLPLSDSLKAKLESPRRNPKRTPRTTYQGLSFHQGRWSVRISKDKMTISLGTFAEGQEEEAARNYDYHSLHLHGPDRAFLNFPDFDYSGFIPKKVIDYALFGVIVDALL